MIKRISCKVIRTIPLSKSIDELRHTSRADGMSDNIKYATRPPNTTKCVFETTTNPRVKDFGKSVVYTHRMNITRIPIDIGLTAGKLNFYA